VRSVFSGDLTVVEGVLVLNEYRLNTLGLPENAVIYDLGANIGTFSLAVKKVCPQARIVAYEPIKENFFLLERNVPFAELHQEAVAGHTGAVSFDFNEQPHSHKMAIGGNLMLPARSLTDLITDQTVDLLKLDIEGAEFEVIEETDPALFKRIKRIVMETHGRGNWGEEKLRSLGYNTSLFWQQEGKNANAIIYGWHN
jgi:FkbM family methyltransferase